MINRDWFNSKCKCKNCGWIGLQSSCKEKRTSGLKYYLVCPNCKLHRDPKQKNCAVMIEFAAHKVCGIWHPEDTECGLTHQEYKKIQFNQLQKICKRS